jgi:hypothetical protein
MPGRGSKLSGVARRFSSTRTLKNLTCAFAGSVIRSEETTATCPAHQRGDAPVHAAEFDFDFLSGTDFIHVRRTDADFRDQWPIFPA